MKKWILGITFFGLAVVAWGRGSSRLQRSEPLCIEASGLVSQKDTLPITFRGNWFCSDGSNEWMGGFYDSLAIYDNQMWKYLSIIPKKKETYVLLSCLGKTKEVRFKSRKDGTVLISSSKGKYKACSRTQDERSTTYANEKNFSDNFFRTDTARIQGYLQGYDAEKKAVTGLINLDNFFNNDEIPIVVEIRSDGSFEVAFALSHPISDYLSLSNVYIPFYIEPGKTLTLFVDYNKLLAYQNDRNDKEFIKGIHYMGEMAATNHFFLKHKGCFEMEHAVLMKYVNNLTPNQFVDQMDKTLAQWKITCDSICKTESCSPFLATFLQNTIWVNYAKSFLDYEKFRRYAYMKDKTNTTIQVKADSSYYNFLKTFPLDDKTLLACSDFGYFINCFQHSSFMWAGGLSWISNEDLLQKLLIKDKVLHKNISMYTNKQYIPFIMQMAMTRTSRFNFETLEEKGLALAYKQNLNKYITHPILEHEINSIFDHLYNDTTGCYELSEGRATEIFRKISNAYKGKYLMVDFWSTGCGPCRYEIEQSIKLREKLRDSKDVDFVFITSEEESPFSTYTDYVNKNLVGEDCYRLPPDDFRYLRQLFRFNGIPHYETLDRKGRVLRKSLNYNNLELNLNKLLEAEKK